MPPQNKVTDSLWEGMHLESPYRKSEAEAGDDWRRPPRTKERIEFPDKHPSPSRRKHRPWSLERAEQKPVLFESWQEPSGKIDNDMDALRALSILIRPLTLQQALAPRHRGVRSWAETERLRRVDAAIARLVPHVGTARLSRLTGLNPTTIRRIKKKESVLYEPDPAEISQRLDRIEQLLHEYLLNAADSARLIAAKMPSNEAVQDAVEALIADVSRKQPH